VEAGPAERLCIGERRDGLGVYVAAGAAQSRAAVATVTCFWGSGRPATGTCLCHSFLNRHAALFYRARTRALSRTTTVPAIISCSARPSRLKAARRKPSPKVRSETR